MRKGASYALTISAMSARRSNHDGNEGDRNAQVTAACGLLMDEAPVSRTTLLVLLGLGRIVERELDIVKGGHLGVVQRLDRIAVRRDRQLDRLRAQIAHELGKVRMHAILT